MWFGGSSLNAKVRGRLVRYGHGFNPFGRPDPAEMTVLAADLAEAGRSIDQIELVGGVRTTLEPGTGPGDLDQALATIPEQIEQGFSTFCIKPGMFIDRPDEFPDFARAVVAGLKGMSPAT